MSKKVKESLKRIDWGKLFNNKPIKSWENKYYRMECLASFNALTRNLAMAGCVWLMYLLVFQYDKTAYDTLNILMIISGYFIAFALMSFGDMITAGFKIKHKKGGEQDEF